MSEVADAAGKTVKIITDNDRAPNVIRVEFADGTALEFVGVWCNDGTADVAVEWADA